MFNKFEVITNELDEQTSTPPSSDFGKLHFFSIFYLNKRKEEVVSKYIVWLIIICNKQKNKKCKRRKND